MGAHRADGDIGRILMRSPLVTAFSNRVISITGEPVLVDHLVATRAGGFVIEERSWPGTFAVEDGHLVRSRSGPRGQWAKGAEDARVDRVRRIAEAVELRLSLPVEPLIVLTAGPTAFASPVVVRGVTVLHADQLPGWLESLPQTTDQAGLAVLAARIERAFHTSDDTRRTPAWKRDRQDDTPPRPQPVRPTPGPRDWSPHVSAAGTEHGTPSEPRTRPRGAAMTTLTPSRSTRSRPGLNGLLIAAVLAMGLYAVQGDESRVADSWDAVAAWATTVNRPAAPGPHGDVGAGTAADVQLPADPPPVAAPVALTSCQVLTAAAISQLLGQTVHQLPSSDPLACHFGPVAGDSSTVWLSVALGPGSQDRTLDGVNGTHQWSPAIGYSPAGPGGRAIATEVAVSMDAALYPSGSQGPGQLFQAVMSNLVAMHEPAAQV